VLRVDLERDQRLGPLDALHLGDAAGDDGREVVMVAHSHDRDQIELAGDGVHLGHAVDVGDRLSSLGDPIDLALDQDDGVHAHGLTPFNRARG
jgi:hypothetical protein